MVNGMPSPAVLCFLPDNTPPLIHLSGFHLLNGHCCFHCRDLLTCGDIHMWQFRLFFSCMTHCTRTHVEDTGEISNPTAMEAHSDDGAFDLRYDPLIGIMP
jgi:hypothetical protein